jgi:NAD(P)-dependent dehydrogenase (short-subunit alcohol dehydrogenase family)
MFDDETKAATKAREALIPRRKNGSPQEIATVALFLASNDSSYVDGMEVWTDADWEFVFDTLEISATC